MSPTVKRQSPWRPAATRYAIPNLSEEWHIISRGLILRPFDFIVRGIFAQQFSISAVLEPLFMPLNYDQASWLLASDCEIRRSFPYDDLKLGEDRAQKYMHDLVQTINETVHPFLVENGSLEGYFERCQRRNSTHPNGLGDPNELYRQAATAAMLRRHEDAIDALEKLRQGIESDPTDDREWVLQLYRQAGELRDQIITDPAAVRAELVAGIDEQKRRRKLPLS